jgi:hypothetical protein
VLASAVVRPALSTLGAWRVLFLALVLAACQVPNNTDYEGDGGPAASGGMGGAGPPAGTGGTPAAPPDARPAANPDAAPPPPRPMPDAGPPAPDAPAAPPDAPPVVSVPRAQPGQRCNVTTDCAGGSCADGVCCVQTCGACQSCAGAGGTCSPAAAGTTDPRCPSTAMCDGAGSCKQMNGTGCGSREACASGFCVDNWCCERACGVCETCGGLSPGTCTPIVNNNDRDNCTGDAVCLGAGNCGHVDQSNFVVGVGGFGTAGAVAQGVVVGRSGRLVAVQVQAGCNAGDVLTLDVRGDAGFVPNSLVLAGQTVTGDALASSDGWRLVVFQSPAQVVAGQRIQLVFGDARASTCSVNTSANLYTAGSMSRFLGGAWTIVESTDIPFQTFVEP